jgi:uncharacterized protein YycO
MPLKVALYDSRTSVISGLIRWETRSKYNHAAIVLRDGTLIESVEGAGVHHLPSLSAATPPDRVDLFNVAGLSDVQAGLVEAFLLKQVGMPYDWPDLTGFITRTFTQEDRGAWFCSELVFAAIEAGGITLLRDIPPFQVSPGTLSLSPLLLPA